MRSGLPTALATILPAVLIAVVRLPRIAPVAWLGAISYSLYLLHVPIGGRVMNLAERLDANAAVATAAVAVSFAVSITVAYVLYILIERPSKAMAAGISYAIEPSGEPQR
jgi:peptidoglycan/LPS O-acetylase OafA/YrhL